MENEPSNDIASSSKSKRNLTDEEHIKKMQKEFEQKRKELLLEAENVVRMREEAYNQELLKLQTELEKHRRLQKEAIDAERHKGTGANFEMKKNSENSLLGDQSQEKNCVIQ